MSALAWSNLILWVVVAVQAVMIVAILRYLGTSVLGAGAPGSGEGPVIRTRPPRVHMENLRGESIALEEPSSAIRNVFFLSTTCKVCDHMLRALRELRGEDPDAADLFVIQGEHDHVAALTSEHELDPEAVVPDARARIFRAWDVGRRPFLVVLDEAGVVQDRGRPEARDRLGELLGHRTTEGVDHLERSPS